MRTFEGHTGSVRTVCIDPSGRHALSGGDDRTIRLWELSSGRCLRILSSNPERVDSLETNRDGRYVVAGCSDGALKLYELRTGMCVREIETRSKSIRSVCMSPCGGHVICGSDDGNLRLWDFGTGQCAVAFEGHAGGVRSACITPDGRYGLSGGNDSSIRLWELATGRCLKAFTGHSGRVNSVSMSPNGRYGLSGGDDGVLQLWELDWNYEFPEPGDWDDGARPYLESFLTLHTKYAARLPTNRGIGHEQVKLALTRQGKPVWRDDDLKKLLVTLGYAGYGWLRPQGVRRELERMTKDWQGPPPLPGGEL